MFRLREQFVFGKYNPGTQSGLCKRLMENDNKKALGKEFGEWCSV